MPLVFARGEPVKGGRLPPLPRGPLEDCGLFAVWWYQRQRKNSESVVTEWSYAIRSTDGISWKTSQAVGGFCSRLEASKAASEQLLGTKQCVCGSPHCEHCGEDPRIVGYS